jgi:hypothetical protein
MEDNPPSFLVFYGLDQLLTDQDDPTLWAAAVRKHWPKAEALEGPIPRLLFGVGRLPDEEEKFHHWGGMESLGRWRFEPNQAGGLKPIQLEGEASELYPEFILEISRPSAGKTTAVVHAGDNPAPLIGYGETIVWKRQPDGSWEGTTERISSWIS